MDPPPDLWPREEIPPLWVLGLVCSVKFSQVPQEAGPREEQGNLFLYQRGSFCHPCPEGWDIGSWLMTARIASPFHFLKTEFCKHIWSGFMHPLVKDGKTHRPLNNNLIQLLLFQLFYTYLLSTY